MPFVATAELVKPMTVSPTEEFSQGPCLMNPLYFCKGESVQQEQVLVLVQQEQVLGLSRGSYNGPLSSALEALEAVEPRPEPRCSQDYRPRDTVIPDKRQFSASGTKPSQGIPKETPRIQYSGNQAVFLAIARAEGMVAPDDPREEASCTQTLPSTASFFGSRQPSKQESSSKRGLRGPLSEEPLQRQPLPHNPRRVSEDTAPKQRTCIGNLKEGPLKDCW